MKYKLNHISISTSNCQRNADFKPREYSKTRQLGFVSSQADNVATRYMNKNG